MTRRAIGWAAVLLLFLLVPGYAAQQSRFEASNPSLRCALLRGEIKEALAYYETEAQQEEKNAAWGAAVRTYLQATDAARFAGQLQKAITYGEKALEIAHRTNVSIYPPTVGRGDLQPPPIPELGAIEKLIYAYNSVRDFSKARMLVERGLRLLSENPAGDPITRLGREGRL